MMLWRWLTLQIYVTFVQIDFVFPNKCGIVHRFHVCRLFIELFCHFLSNKFVRDSMEMNETFNRIRCFVSVTCKMESLPKCLLYQLETVEELMIAVKTSYLLNVFSSCEFMHSSFPLPLLLPFGNLKYDRMVRYMEESGKMFRQKLFNKLHLSQYFVSSC